MSNEETRSDSPQNKSDYSDNGDRGSDDNKPTDVSLHVGNLKYETTADTLRDLFSKYGNVLDVDIVKKDDGSSKGHAFVIMENRDDAEKAIDELHKTQLDGRQITVTFKKTQEQLRAERPSRRGDKRGRGSRRNDSSRRRRDDRYERSDRYSRYDDDDRRYRESRRSSRYDSDRHRSSRRSSRYDDSPPRRRRSSRRSEYSDSDYS